MLLKSALACLSLPSLVETRFLLDYCTMEEGPGRVSSRTVVAAVKGHCPAIVLVYVGSMKTMFDW
jgi:hypothetical protein